MAEYRLTPDGVQARPLTKEEREILQLAEARLTQVRVPKLMESSHDRVYVAAMDGTGNDRIDHFASRTIVARLGDELRDLGNPAISVGYTSGIGTQDRFLTRAIDRMAATTFDARVEHAYLELCRQAYWWLKDDSEARIRVAGIGFSRGAEAVAALQRMVHERGIRDPGASESRYGPDGILTHITWADRPPLVPPGQTAQIALLIDPVATGLRDHDRRLPASNVGALQFTSLHERRDHFQGTLLVPLGLSEGGRVANLPVPGAHSNAGGSYLLDGIGRVVHNAGVDYLNSAFGEALLQRVPVAIDPRMFVAHRSDQHMAGFWPSGEWRRKGVRGLHAGLGPSCEPAGTRPRPRPKSCLRDPIDHRLADELDYRHVERGRPPGGTDTKMELAQVAIGRMYERFPTPLDHAMAANPAPGSAQVLKARDGLQEKFEQLVEASRQSDELAFKAATRAYMATPVGQIFKPGFTAVQAWMTQVQAPAELSRPLAQHQYQQLEPAMQP